MQDDQTLRNVNDLIQENLDAEAGFRNAAATIRNTELETLFNGYAERHAQFAQELQTEAKRLGTEPATAGTMGGAAHRGWMDLKSTLSGHSVAAILNSCESGADAAVAAYEGAVGLGVKIEGKTRTIVERHLKTVREILTRIRRLADEVNHGTVFPTNE